MKTHPHLRAIAAPILVVVSVFLLYLAKPNNIQVADAIWAPHVAVSLIYDRDPYLNEYRQQIEQWNFTATFEEDGDIHSFFPLGGQALVVPQMMVIDAIVSQLNQTNLRDYLITHSPTDLFTLKLQLVNASLLIALSAGVMFLIGREYLNIPFALILAAIYAFGTSAYSTASRAMWQHGPSMLMLSIALLLLIKARKRPHFIMVAGLPVAIAFIVRPTNSISVLVVTLYVLICYRKQFIGYLLFALLPAVPFILVNLNLYDQILPPYYGSGRLGFSNVGEALSGNLISAGRGLFIFSPVLLLVPLGIGIRAGKRQWATLDWALVAIITLHWLAISSYDHWWAGHSFGPRFFSDALPFLVYFLIPVLETLQSQRGSAVVQGTLSTLLGVLVVISVAIHYRGATSVSTSIWNSVPVDVDDNPDRVWDWSDLQFLRGLGSELIALAPGEISLEPGDALPPQSAYLEIGRLTDSPVDLAIRLPARVNLAEHSAWLFNLDPLPGGGKAGRLREPFAAPGMWRFDIEVDTTTTAAGQSLNAIEITAGIPTREGTLREEIHVIPVAVGTEAGNSLVLPSDIRINCPIGGSGALYALLGAGWYDQESAGDATWRWAASPAHLLIWSDGAQEIAIEAAISSLHGDEASDGLGDEGVFHVTLPDGATTITGQTAHPLRFDAPLQAGWNRVTFELEAGNFRPADLVPGHYEVRELSFSVGNITLTGNCQQ